ncbi:MAG: hypothetical protein CSA58_04840 [Micrococcales bacterium]|nr:MAG: hypothetical protein CSB46_06405 [Micrococcales bacterium]PIE27335.1 MAG: hypothetical protein CSA58_04840 [Micrococcales bacterium]
MGFIERLFGRDWQDPQLQGRGVAAPAATASKTDKPTSDHSIAVQQALTAYWEGVGDSDPDPINYLVNPAFENVPRWPGTRQAFRVVRTNATVILSSDGLSDPDPTSEILAPGAGCEIYLETADLLKTGHQGIMDSWQFRALENMAGNIALAGDIKGPLRRYGVLSTELSVEAPSQLLSDNGTLGALIGMPVPNRPRGFRTTIGDVDMIAMTVITAAELAEIVDGGASARESVARRRIDSGTGHLSVE